jgi:hypothetical protein
LRDQSKGDVEEVQLSAMGFKKPKSGMIVEKMECKNALI